MRNGNWMYTNSGRRFYFQDVLPEDICIKDIAKGLSKLCRFTGQIDYLYTVAQHSVLVSELVPEQFALEALMHDAGEAYTNDLSTPLKRDLSNYRDISDKITACIYKKYDLQFPLPKEVHEVDSRIVIDEALALFTNTPEWALDRIDERIGTKYLKKLNHSVWRPKTAERKFIERLQELVIKKLDYVA